MITFSGLADLWNGFFHAPESAHTVALFRILFGGLLLINAALFARDARLWIGPNGIFAHGDFCRTYGHSRFTLLRYLPATDGSVALVLGLHLVAACCLTVGLWTPGSAGVVFVTLVSLQHRNPLVCYGGDDVMRIMALLIMFSGAGDVASIDRWWADRLGQPEPVRTAWCTRLMQLQVSIVYLQAFLSKFSGSTWRTGSAVYYAVEVPKYQRLRLPAFARTLAWSRFMSWWTMAVEFALGPLIWFRELRPAILVAGITLHLGMEAFMNLHLFGPMMIACLLLFLDPARSERILGLLLP